MKFKQEGPLKASVIHITKDIEVVELQDPKGSFPCRGRITTEEVIQTQLTFGKKIEVPVYISCIPTNPKKKLGFAFQNEFLRNLFEIKPANFCSIVIDYSALLPKELKSSQYPTAEDIHWAKMLGTCDENQSVFLALKVLLKDRLASLHVDQSNIKIDRIEFENAIMISGVTYFLLQNKIADVTKALQAITFEDLNSVIEDFERAQFG
ncbi:MAG: hypothetical protein ACRCXZ_00115 [Patescibacteria group bacterium]